MHVTNRARVKLHTVATRRAAVAWRAIHVLAPASDYSAQSVLDISGAKRFSRTTNRVRLTRNPFVYAAEIVLSVVPS